MSELSKMIARSLNSISALMNRVSRNLGMLMLLVMLCAVALQVIARYLFLSPPAWTEELARYAMVWAGYLGATVAFYSNEDPVLHMPKDGTELRKKTYLVARSVAGLVFLLPVVYWSPTILEHHMLRETESLKFVSAYVMLIVPIFSSIILFHIAARLWDAFMGPDSNPSGETL